MWRRSFSLALRSDSYYHYGVTSILWVPVLIVGAGISGIGAAYYLQRDHPQRSYAILEARGASGGTWDLFRFPGVRSDSDLHTFGYQFRPWRSDTAIADSGSILSTASRPVASTSSTVRAAGRPAVWASDPWHW